MIQVTATPLCRRLTPLMLMGLAASLLGISCDPATQLHRAASEADEGRVRTALAAGASPDVRDERGDTPLHAAAKCARTAGVVRLLIEAGADVNAENHQGWTPLHRLLDLEVARMLIRHGADLESRSRNGKTPLHMAAKGWFTIELREGWAESPAARAALNKARQSIEARRAAVVRLFVESGANVNARSNHGRTPLHVAADEGHLDDVKLLLQHGADPFAEDDGGHSPLQSAEIFGQKDTAEFLRAEMAVRRGAEEQAEAPPPLLSVESLVSALTSDDVAERRRATQGLGDRALERMTPELEAAVPKLAEALRDSDAGVRHEAAFALARMGPGAAITVGELIDALADEDPDVPPMAALALGRIGPAAARAAPALAKALESESVALRRTATDALAEIGPEGKAAVPALSGAMKDEDAYVRARAARALGKMGVVSSQVVSPLRQCLQDRDKHVRLWAASSLQRLQPTGNTVVRELVPLLSDGDPRIRQEAVRAIGEAGPAAKDATPALIGAFNTLGAEGRMDCLADALGKMGPAGIEALVKALKEGDAETRARAAWALGWIGPSAKAAIPALVAATKDEDLAVCIMASDALRHVREDRQEDPEAHRGQQQ